MGIMAREGLYVFYGIIIAMKQLLVAQLTRNHSQTTKKKHNKIKLKENKK